MFDCHGLTFENAKPYCGTLELVGVRPAPTAPAATFMLVIAAIATICPGGF
jgi:hypothetical protein